MLYGEYDCGKSSTSLHPLQLNYFSVWEPSVPGNHHHTGPQMGEHQLLHQKESAVNVLPVAVEEVQSVKVIDGALLQCQQVHPVHLHHCVVHCYHRQGQRQAAAYHQSCWKGDLLPSLQDLHSSRALNVQERLQLTPPSPDILCFNCSPLAGGCGPTGPQPATIEMASHLLHVHLTHTHTPVSHICLVFHMCIFLILFVNINV